MCLMRLPIKLKKLHNEGEISVYLCLIFTVLLSLIVSVITAARGAAIQVVFECALESALCSAFGEYNKELLDRYDVFYIDLSYLSNSPDPENLEERIYSYFEDNLHPEEGTNLLFVSDFTDITACNIEVNAYSLATDYLGQSFREQAIAYIKGFVNATDIEGLRKIINVSDEYNLTSADLAERQEEIEMSLSKKDEDTWEQTKVKEELMDLVDFSLSDTALLALDTGKLSTKTINYSDTILFREKEKGIDTKLEISLDPSDDLYFDEYIVAKLGNYLEPKENTALDYEVEYVLVGANSDVANEIMVVPEIFLIRVGADLVSLNLAKDKREKISAVASLISAFIEVPEPIITEIILFIWAQPEAVTDVIDIMKGEKIPLIKRSDEINVSVDGLLPYIASLVDFEAMPKEEADTGNILEDINIKLGYKDYLRILLYEMPLTIKTYRTMDMIEHDMRMGGSGENMFFRFDACADSVSVTATIESGFDFRYVTEKNYSYF